MRITASRAKTVRHFVRGPGKARSRVVGAFIALALALMSQTNPVNGAPAASEVEKRQIEAAAPARASATPKRSRRILVFSRAWGYKHTSIPYGEIALEIMGRKTGAFSTTVTDDDRYFEEEELSGFDAVALNNSNNEVFLPENFKDLSTQEQAEARIKDERLRGNLRKFIAGGKGLAVIHAGIATFRDWPEFGEIMGARFDNHPWNAGSTVTLKIEEPEHPVARAFGGSRFEITDEIYQFKGNYSRANLRVLISIDTACADMNKGAAIHRKDNNFALGWIRRYGDGRVFYCALGHQHDIFWNPTVLRHYLDGVQFAIGDLEADASPVVLKQ